MRVLLIDDEEELVSTLAERLDLRGIDSDWVTTGEEGVRLAEKVLYDWIVLDLKMPGLGGMETMQAIRAVRPDAKVMVLTGHASQDQQKEGMEAGANHYLLKPIDVEELLRLMQEG